MIKVEWSLIGYKGKKINELNLNFFNPSKATSSITCILIFFSFHSLTLLNLWSLLTFKLTNTYHSLLSDLFKFMFKFNQSFTSCSSIVEYRCIQLRLTWLMAQFGSMSCSLKLERLKMKASYSTWSNLVDTWMDKPHMSIISWFPLRLCWFARLGCILGYLYNWFSQFVPRKKERKKIIVISSYLVKVTLRPPRIC